MNPTIDEIIKVSGVHPARVKNIYLYGSRVYGTATEKSDYDFILIGSSLLAKEEKRVGNINVHIHTNDVFKDGLFKHDVHYLECIYSPLWAHYMEKEPLPRNFQLNPNKVKQSFLAQSFTSWQNGKKKMYDGDIYRAIKSVWHSIRILQFGIQLVENGSIVDFSCANDLWNNELKDCEQFEWSYFKQKYFNYKLDLENKLRNVSPLVI